MSGERSRYAPVKESSGFVNESDTERGEPVECSPTLGWAIHAVQKNRRIIIGIRLCIAPHAGTE